MLIFFLLSIVYSQVFVPEHVAKILTVQGSASDYVNTTEVIIGFAVETQEKTAELSFSKNKKITQTVERILDDMNIPVSNITTTAFTITPVYDTITFDNRTTKEIYKGVKVTNEYKVRLPDVNSTSELIDRITRADVNIISYINFDIPQEDTYKLRNNLIKRAVEDAQSRAKSMASSLNVKLGNVKSVTYQTPYVYQYQRSYANSAALELAASAPAPTIYADTNKKITANVDLVYYIIN
jgi:uncharacterized protein YggE